MTDIFNASKKAEDDENETALERPDTMIKAMYVCMYGNDNNDNDSGDDGNGDDDADE